MPGGAGIMIKEFLKVSAILFVLIVSLGRLYLFNSMRKRGTGQT